MKLVINVSFSGGLMVKRFDICGWEYDASNGEYVYKDYYCDSVEADNIQEALEKAMKWLEEDIKEGETNGWECDEVDGDVSDDKYGYVSTFCSKLDKECVEICKEDGGDEEECESKCYISHQIGYDISESS